MHAAPEVKRAVAASEVKRAVAASEVKRAVAAPAGLAANAGDQSRHWISYAVLLLLLLVCAASGMHAASGLALPPDLDALRDIGFAQGILDHNWFGDQEYGDAARYYPPLIPALGALAAAVSGRDLPALWVTVGPWVNLLIPITFFLAVRRMFASSEVAATATAVLVLFNGALIVPWLAGGYTPWLLSPLLAQAAFFASLLLIRARLPRARWSDAVWIGLAIGLTFLAHVIPALLLTAMLIVGALVEHRLRWRTIGWLAVCGAVQAVLMAIYVVPILLYHPGGIVNLIPGSWSPALLQPDRNALLHLAVANAPGLAGLAATSWLRRAAPIAPVTWAMLLTWIGVCAAFLLRHEACGWLPGLDASAACQVLRMPAHHFHLYLQLAWAVVLGYAVWTRVACWAVTAARRRAAFAIGFLLLVCAGVLVPLRKYDRTARADALATGGAAPMDLAAYRWLLGNTAPDASFVTATVGDPALGYDQAAFTVMAAGRRLVAVGRFFSSPYVDWTTREARRRQLLSSITGGACGPFDRDLWAILPSAMPIAAGRAVEKFRTDELTIYQVRPCD